MLDRYTLFSLLSIGLAKILFKEKIDRRRIVKQLQAIDVNKQLKQDLKNINALTENVLKTIDELKNDITRNVEKTLVMNQGVINEIEKDKIREQAVRDFLNKMKKQNPTLKKGISIGKIQRK